MLLHVEGIGAIRSKYLWENVIIRTRSSHLVPDLLLTVTFEITIWFRLLATVNNISLDNFV
jgi:hypothetical protein